MLTFGLSSLYSSNCSTASSRYVRMWCFAAGWRVKSILNKKTKIKAKSKIQGKRSNIWLSVVFSHFWFMITQNALESSNWPQLDRFWMSMSLGPICAFQCIADDHKSQWQNTTWCLNIANGQLLPSYPISNWIDALLHTIILLERFCMQNVPLVYSRINLHRSR